MRVLVVEDEEVLASAVVEFLEAAGLAVDHAPNGSEAASLRRDHDYDVVILDWNVPPPTGVELLREWRSSGDEAPVVLTTGSHDPSGLDPMLLGDSVVVMTKPYSLVHLLETVYRLSGGSGGGRS